MTIRRRQDYDLEQQLGRLCFREGLIRIRKLPDFDYEMHYLTRNRKHTDYAVKYKLQNHYREHKLSLFLSTSLYLLRNRTDNKRLHYRSPTDQGHYRSQ